MRLLGIDLPTPLRHPIGPIRFNAVALLFQINLDILKLGSLWRAFLYQLARPVWVSRGCSEVRSD